MQGVIGVSGTIERTDGRCIMDMTGYKAMKLGKRIPHIVYLYRQALRDNVIPPFKIHVYQIAWTDLTYDEQEEYVMLTKQAKIAESMAMKEYDITREQMRHYMYADYPLVSKANAKYRERKRLINNAQIRYELAHEIITEYMARGLRLLSLLNPLEVAHGLRTDLSKKVGLSLTSIIVVIPPTIGRKQQHKRRKNGKIINATATQSYPHG